MYGMNVHRAVLAAGDPVSGASVHLVSEEYDAGPVLGQKVVPVVAGETAEQLAARVQVMERELLVSTLAEVATGRILPNSALPPPRLGASGSVVASEFRPPLSVDDGQ